MPDTTEPKTDRRAQGRSSTDIRRMVFQFLKDGALLGLMVLVWRVSTGFSAVDSKVETQASKIVENEAKSAAKFLQIEKDAVRQNVLIEKMSDAIQVMQISNQKNVQQDAELLRLGGLLDKGKDERVKWQTDMAKLLQDIVVNGVETKVLLKDHLAQPARQP